MDILIFSKLRHIYWLVFLSLFVFWYMLLYGFDWSSTPQKSFVSHIEKDPIRSLDSKALDQSSIAHDDTRKSTENSLEDVNSKSNDAAEKARNSSEGSFDSADASGQSVNVTSSSVESSNVTNSSAESSNSTNIVQRKENSTSDEDQDDVPDIESLEKALEPILGPDDSKDEEQQEDAENGKRKPKSCEGRYIYIHDIPSQFNDDLLKQCKSLVKWIDMCPYFTNMGLGPDLGNPQKLFTNKGWYNTDQFSLEIIFHNRMKKYDCLTNDSSQAAAIFVPYYAGLDIMRYLWGKFSYSRRDEDSQELVKWLREKPEWEIMSGKDHFMVVGRITWDFRRGIDEDYGWGNKLMLLPEIHNMTILTIESSPWNRNDFGIPYPTYFHPSSDNEIHDWQNKMRKQRRKTLFSFAGAPRPNLEDSIRSEMMQQCIAARRKCKLLECKTLGSNKCMKPPHVMRLFQNSIFCLQPPGDSYTRRSTFDSILAGCIPVFFNPASAYTQYLWHLPKNFEKYSVLIREDHVKAKKVSIEKVLSQIPKSKVSAMREEVIKLIPKVVYADPRSGLETSEDAFDLTVKGVLQRVEMLRKDMKEGKNTSENFEEEKSWQYYFHGTTENDHEWNHFFLRSNRMRY